MGDLGTSSLGLGRDLAGRAGGSLEIGDSAGGENDGLWHSKQHDRIDGE